MIHEMDASIRSFLRAGAANGDDVEVAFDASSTEVGAGGGDRREGATGARAP